MSVTEIYSCKDGQKLKEGRLDLSHDITTKEQAQADARRRCKLDPSLRKVAYYAVTQDGRFRHFFTHTNDAATPSANRTVAAMRTRPRRPVRSDPPPQGLLAWLLKTLGFG